MMQSNYSVIEAKLDDFIRKFYSNRIVVGILLLVLVAAVSLFTVFMIEGFAFMQPAVKTVLFYFLLFVFATIFVYFIAIPLGKLLKIIPYISYEEAAGIISEYFSDSNDMLLNVIQLNRGESNDFLVAAINQKIDKISPWNFTHAINFSKTLKFLYVSCGVLAFLLFVSYLFRTKMSSGASRFMNYSVYYQPDNPYSVKILNDSLRCASGDDFTVQLCVDGPSSPQDVFIKNSVLNVRMNVDSANHYSYTFKNLTDDIVFSVGYLDFQTDDYEVSVFQKPQILGVTVSVAPPAYTNINTDEFSNSGDFTVPFGSQIRWKFDVDNCNDFDFYVDSVRLDCVLGDGDVVAKKTALKTFDYSYAAVGDNGYKFSSNLFHVKIVPDYYPQIQVVSAVDSSAANAVFFSGNISDDYGFHSLNFCYFDSNSPQSVKSQSIDISSAISQDFYFYFDFNNMPKSVSYYFEVKDNDAISGFKSSKTPISVYTTITNEEKQERLNNLNNSITDKVDQAQRLLHDLNNDLNDFQKSISSNDKVSDWEKQLKLNNMMDKQNKLQQLMQELSQENISKNAFENQLSPDMSDELLEKQKQLQELWDNLLTDDIKELLDKIKEMTQSLNEKNLRDNLQDLKFDFNQISEQLDRNNELMKMYNVDSKLQNLSKDLDKLASDYREVAKDLKENKSEKTSDNRDNNAKKDGQSSKSDKDNTKSSNDLLDKMKDLKNQFDQKFDDYNDLLKQNSELGDNKLDIRDLNKEFQDLKNNLEFQLNEMSKLQNIDKHNQKTDDVSRENIEKYGSYSDKKNDSNDAKSDKNDSKMNFELGGDSNDSDSKSDLNDSDNINNEKDHGEISTENVNKNKSRDKSDLQNSNSDKSDDMKSGNNKNNQGDAPQNSGGDTRKSRENLSQMMEESADDMEELSDMLQGMNQKNQEQKNKENLNDIRQILDNLLTISFNQETLIEQLKNNRQNSFMSTDLLKSQNSISKDFSLVKDSIYALAKREPKLGHAVYDKIDNINDYSNKIISGINSNSRSLVATNQQLLLTNVNDLALLFNEIADQMQNQSGQQGNDVQQQQQENTSRNKKEMQQREQNTQQIKSTQQSLKQQLQKMLQQLQNGDKPSSQQLVESLKMQEMMMQKLQEMKNSRGLSSEEQKLMNQIQEMMEQNKKDIINRNLDRRLIDRQDVLFNKLLDLEKAEKSKDTDENRESKQGTDIQINNNKNLNLKLKDFGTKEFINLSPINLNLFYQNIYNDYIQNID